MAERAPGAEQASVPSPRRDAERNRSMLLEAAADELVRRPGASMVDVARAAGLTRATLYRHFGSREKLLEGLQDEALARAARVLEEARLGEGPPPAALRRAVLGLARLGARFRALLEEGVEVDPAFQQRRAEVLAPLAQVVHRGQADGTLVPDVPPAWVLTALAALLAAAIRGASGPADDGEAIGELVYRTLAHGIVAPGARPADERSETHLSHFPTLEA